MKLNRWFENVNFGYEKTSSLSTYYIVYQKYIFKSNCICNIDDNDFSSFWCKFKSEIIWEKYYILE
jgi:hypothetical protein